MFTDRSSSVVSDVLRNQTEICLKRISGAFTPSVNNPDPGIILIHEKQEVTRCKQYLGFREVLDNSQCFKI